MKKLIISFAILMVIVIVARNVWYYPVFKRPPILEVVSDLPVMMPYFQLKENHKVVKKFLVIRDDKRAVFPEENHKDWSKWKNKHEIYLGDTPGWIKIFVEEKWKIFRKRSAFLFYQGDQNNRMYHEMMKHRYIFSELDIDEKFEIVYIGDSLTNGLYASDERKSFVSIIHDSIGKTKIVIAKKGIRLLETNVSQIQKSVQNADYVIIELGTNDFNITSLDEFEKKYLELVRTIKSSNNKSKIVFCSTWHGYKGYEYDQVIYNIAVKNSGLFVYIGDLCEESENHATIGQDTPWGKADYFHPSDKGHSQIAKRILGAITKNQ